VITAMGACVFFPSGMQTGRLAYAMAQYLWLLEEYQLKDNVFNEL
jgi:hypothetical protein